MSNTIQENTATATMSVTMDTPVKKVGDRKAKKGANGGAGDKPEKPKKGKKLVPVSKTWNVPTKHDAAWEQTKFLKHVHSLIKELAPQLLETSSIRDEFNKLVELLSKFTNTDFVSWIPSPRSRYSLCLTMNAHYVDKYSFLGNYGRWQNWTTRLSPEKESIENEWLKFWNLIKPTIWGPLKKVHFDTECRDRIKNYQQTVIAIEYEVERKIAQIREKAENQKKYYIEQITNLLKQDPDYKD
jgi:hypothetical protein